jgi:Tfp pilus assembly protein PilF
VRAASRRRRILLNLSIGLFVVCGALGTYLALRRHTGLPSPGTDAYEQTARRFYRGLAQLQVGLIDAATQDLAQAATLAPGEPAIWADLGLAHLRLGDFDAAGRALERATALAPDSGEVAFLMGRLETSRGRREEGLAQLRRAVELDQHNLPARTALIDEVENAGRPDSDAEAQRLLDQLAALQPDNPAVILERARLAAKRADAPALQSAIARIGTLAGGWPAEVVEQLRAVQQASSTASFPDASRGLVSLRNALAQVPTFRESRRLVTPSAELVAEPVTRFLRLPVPLSTPSPPDVALTFAPDTAGLASAGPASALAAFSLDGDQTPAVFAADDGDLRRLGVTGQTIAFASGETRAPLPVNGLLALDWNADFKLDLVTAGKGGVRLFVQGADGTFSDATARASSRDQGAANVDATGAWAADIEMDGDLDIVVGVRGAAPVVLRNNGDGTWQAIHPFPGVVGLRAFAWGDIDGDGDPDAALIDGRGELKVFANLQAGQFQLMPGPDRHLEMRAIALGDIDADGVFDLVTVDSAGGIFRASFGGGGWRQEPIASWRSAASPAALETARLMLEDVDNNGALDLIASDASGTAIWLAGEDRHFAPLRQTIAAQVWAAVDFGRGGQLDLIGLLADRPVRLNGLGTRGYHYQRLRLRAQQTAGDQRINSFGIGGEVEVRSGLLVQKQNITGPSVHIGLGARARIDVTRVVWPNGVPQAEFDPGIDQLFLVERRLKGSCPWVFADDGTGLHFVTDFLWRSPLGLRINAQETAGVTQTEDWIRIRGDQLHERGGAYDVRITAELWETHFVDHVSLMTVDHPSDVDVFVDERFAREPPALAVTTMRPPTAVVHATDETGRDVTDLVTRKDGRYLSTFPLGAYQGVAADHYVDIDLGAGIPQDTPTWLVAYGWIYPTDSSINVAIGQGGVVQPRGLSLEAQDKQGRWVVVAPDLGFPAGKNKTILVDLRTVARAGVIGAQRLRLRTNLEIYWDWIGWAEGVADPTLKTVRVEASRADLRYRGFSETRTDRRDQPEVPVYDRIANTVPKWRDLIGYYTRFGDVRELLGRIDDRYVIMNAGDEIRLSFPAPPSPPSGWSRDFVLIGDGWVKDGDYNTSFSKTVLPLPAHGHPNYSAASSLTLGQDPVYLRHRADWETFHTRFVTPSAFLAGLAFPGPPREPQGR